MFTEEGSLVQQITMEVLHTKCDQLVEGLIAQAGQQMSKKMAGNTKQHLIRFRTVCEHQCVVLYTCLTE